MAQVKIITHEDDVHLAEKFSIAYEGEVIDSGPVSAEDEVTMIVDVDPTKIGNKIDPSGIIGIKDSPAVEIIARAFAIVAVKEITRIADKPDYDDGRQYFINDERPAIRLKQEDGVMTLARTLPTSKGENNFEISMLDLTPSE